MSRTTQSESSGPVVLHCRKCGQVTSREHMSSYGAQCVHCYGRWVKEHRTFPNVGDKAANGPRDWIRGLQARIDAGEKLTQFQRHCLEHATRYQGSKEAA